MPNPGSFGQIVGFPPPPPFFPAAGQAIVTVLNGQTAEVIPAPPAGFVHVCRFAMVQNDDAAATLAFTVQDDLGLQGMAQAALPLAAATVANLSLLTLDSALTMTVGGAAVSGTFHATYYRVPKPAAPNYLVGTLQLTAAYQQVLIVPTKGIAVPFLTNSTASVPNFGSALIDSDTTTPNINWRVTRDTNIYTFTSSTTRTATSSSRTLGPMGEAILPGDIWEAKTAAPPAAPNTFLLRWNFEIIPALA